MYPKHMLLEFGDWSRGSKQYVSSIEGIHLNIAKAVGEHFRAMSKLDQSIQDIFYQNTTVAEQDFFNIEDSHKRFLRKQWITIFVEQVGKEKDPYDYLHRYLPQRKYGKS